MSTDNRVLVLCATGKVGKNVCIALKEKGFDVYGTTRNAKNNLEAKGIKPVVCNYIDKTSLTQALTSTGIKQVFMITDYFLAAKSKKALEIEQGKMIVDCCKECGVTFVIYSSAGDLESFNDKVHHIKGKIDVENYLKASGLRFGIVRPVAFFENLDDPANWNPLKKGSVKFLTECKVSMCATIDIGKAAAVMFQNQEEWNGKTVDVASWKVGIVDIYDIMIMIILLSTFIYSFIYEYHYFEIYIYRAIFMSWLQLGKR